MYFKRIAIALCAALGFALMASSASAGAVAVQPGTASVLERKVDGNKSALIDYVGKRRGKYRKFRRHRGGYHRFHHRRKYGRYHGRRWKHRRWRRHRGPRFGIYIGVPHFHGGRYCYRRCRYYHGPRYCRRHAWRYC